MSGETETAPITEETAEETVPTTTADAEAWLNATKPTAVLALLKDPDFRAAVTPAFAGFQPNARSLSLPFVRGKLAQIAVKDDKVAEKLRSLSESDAKPILPAASAEEKPSPLSQPARPDPLPALKAERDARRKERDAARQELTEAKNALDLAVKGRIVAEAERDDVRQTAKKHNERIARLERQAAKAKQLEARLVKALNEDKVSPAPATRQNSIRAKEPDTAPVSAAWPIVVTHLLDKAKFDTALALAEDVLKTDPDDPDALQIAARAYEGRKEKRPAFGMARRLLTLLLRNSDFPAAADTLGTLLRLAASPEQVEPDVRLFLTGFPSADSSAVTAARLLLSRLRGSSPNTFTWLADYIILQTALGPILMPPPGVLGPDDPLPLLLTLGRPVTARQLSDAVDRVQTALVDTARSALQELEATDPSTFARVWAALEQAASDDPPRLLPLRRSPRGAAVVDGSNVAWFDQESLSHGHPRLRSVRAVRRVLWAKGFFPVVLYADANLPYFIDDKFALTKMRDRQEISFVDAGTSADEVLLRVAKQMNALLVTNDKMEDWDPEHTVRKARYTVSMSGEAHLLSEI